ncbi:DNA polymerase epsilon catalytic subunit [Vigna angularis]|uniref:DNA polymerase epsilon catalytic subunit n=1 Tax=Phaseolus angularis TaxID=3914 RepID=A0A8T0KCB8_PHAAN|nr:DNA polymerase epsilon catalytic subunit [Vigna angularis]
MSGDGRRRDRRDTRAPKKRKLNRNPEDELEAKLGFDLFSEGEKRLGWLLTLASSSVQDENSYKEYSCVDLYFVTQDGSSFKSKFRFRPYFYVATKDKMEMDVEAYLRRRYEGQIADIEIIDKEDLDLKNHLSGLRKSYLKLSFDTVQQLMDVKRDLMPSVERNKAKSDTAEAFVSMSTERREHRPQDFLDCLTDLREYDVPYHVRFAIDNDIRCGQWYDVGVSNNGVKLEKRTDLLQRAEVRVCAFDIETTKLPLKFPDADYDLVMMISYMCVGDDIEDIEYTPKPEFEGCFKVTNVQNEELGFKCDTNQGECRAKYACHLDCFAWVKRDSYLPQGSQGLKAVTKAKLGYDPVEVHPEDMVRFAKEKPQMMASYSVSDAVATYYLYKTYVHPFIFSLATIIPMPPDEVLRKGSGTLCEMLLMVQAYKANVICPNKHQSDPEKFYNNHLLESETYIGGHVECLESGVFRSDIPSSFTLEPSAFQQLINNLDRDLQYAITVEGKMDLESVSNYDEVRNAIMEKLVKLRDVPTREECPLIYHLDVAAMYPNIILTNRLQPPSIVTDEVCTACDFNRPGKTCLRKLEWVWRGETFIAKKSDYYALKTQIESEFVDDSENNKSLPRYSEKRSSKSFLDLPKSEQISRLKDRLKKYCQKAYKRVLDKPVTEIREAGICMRENPFYVDTVRSFRDRRYEYKGLNKIWKGKLSEAKASGNSMKIQEAQTLTDPIRKTYTTHSECSIEFEVDGPYKAMILPASKEEGILIKKRYAVFNDDGTLAELKGFEIKRRGELKLIKVFQAELFDKFLHGSSLEECYSAVASVANRWLDLLDNQGKDIADSELLDYISESSTMSKSLADYGEQKSCAVTTAKRLADFLGDTMVKDKGLRCQYIVASEPKGTPVSERAIPVAIFETDAGVCLMYAEVMKFYVRKWCKVSLEVAIRSIIDWSYYKQRLSSAIQKIVTIPAAMQKVSNPVPRVAHPDWLHKKVREKEDKFRQRKIVDAFKPMNKNEHLKKLNDSNRVSLVMDDEILNELEDFGNKGRSSTYGPRPIIRHYEANNEQNSRKLSDQQDLEQEHSKDNSSKKNLLSPPQQDETYENIDRNVDYQGWLQVKKRMWKNILERRKKQRVFYLNSRSPITEEFMGKRVNKNLPHGRLNYNLYEVSISEIQYGEVSKKLATLLADPDIEVSIRTNHLVDKTANKRSLHEPWNLSELHMKTTTECVYLEQSLSFFYLYHSISEGRAIYVGYFPASKAITVVVVNPYQNKDLLPTFLERQFHDACQALSIDPPPRNDINFKVDYVAHVKDAETVMQRAINSHSHGRENHVPMVAVIECPNVQLVKLGIRALDDFPCLSVPYNARDSQYQILGWQQTAGKVGMQRCAASVRWLNERIALSRYAHVPLGNFELDWLIFMADIFFSRALRDNQQVLWISDDGLPDLGGINGEQNFFVDEIHHLAVNALLKYSLVNEMEGGTLLGFGHEHDSGAFSMNDQNGFDESTSCAHAFRVLKQLIQRCLADAVTSGNVYADSILQHLYRWLCSPKSKLHDPALHQLLHKVMQKVFALLLAEFRKLGATIVFANFTKIIIDTGKYDLSRAKAYCDSLLRTIQSRDLFEWIELEPLQFWCSLLFMDQYNYGGIPVKSDEAMNDKSQVDIISSWNIAEYLPKKVQDHFVFIVSQFMYIPWNYAQNQAQIRASFKDGDTCTPSISIGAAAAFESEITEYIKEQISSYFADKLLGIVHDISLHMKGVSRSENNQSISPGPELHRGDAALEFIKHVCAVLALDQSVQHEVLVLRKNLLKYVGVREFAPEAEFHDPCHSFVLSNVICSYCNDCRDLDLCRDLALLTEEWRCAVPQCGQPYDRETVRQRERLYHLQDVVCIKCHQVKAAHLAEQCACAGSFSCKEDANEFRRKMQNFFKDKFIMET